MGSMTDQTEIIEAIATDVQHFVVHLNQRPRSISGPYLLAELVLELQSGSIQWTDMVWTDRCESKWQRLFEFQAVHSVMSEVPTVDRLKKYSEMCGAAVRGEPQKSQEKSATDIQSLAMESLADSGTQDGDSISIREVPDPQMPIYLQVAGGEFGPLSLPEVKKVIESNGFKEQIYIWYKGLDTWFPIEELIAMKKLDIAPKEARTSRRGVSLLGLLKNRDHRNSIRHRIVATCAFKDQGRRVSLGVCADFSRTGFQVWVERENHFDLGQILELEIVPLSVTGLSTWHLKGKVVWFRSDELRLGLMFTETPPEVAEQISNYLQKVEYDVSLRSLK